MTPAQNPTIGLLICKGKDNTEVQYAFNGITTPMGFASYDNIQIQKLQEQLPSIEELKALIQLLEEELDKKASSGISYRLTVLSCRNILLSVYASDSNVSSLLTGFNSHSQMVIECQPIAAGSCELSNLAPCSALLC